MNANRRLDEKVSEQFLVDSRMGLHNASDEAEHSRIDLCLLSSIRKFKNLEWNKQICITHCDFPKLFKMLDEKKIKDVSTKVISYSSL